MVPPRDKTGQFEYEMAFDINMKDVTGQSALYLACYVGNQKLVDLLLKHRVQGHRVKVGPSLSASGIRETWKRRIISLCSIGCYGIEQI